MSFVRIEPQECGPLWLNRRYIVNVRIVKDESRKHDPRWNWLVVVKTEGDLYTIRCMNEEWAGETAKRITGERR